MRSYDRHDLLGAGFAGYVFGLITACVVAMSVGGCAKTSPLQPGARVIPVAITAWPSPIGPACALPDLPEPPNMMLFERPDEADLSRYYVTQRQLADLVQWHSDVRHVLTAYAECLRKLTERP